MYATYAMKLCLAHILLNYHVTSPLKMEDLRIRMSISFRFAKSSIVQLRRRQR